MKIYLLATLNTKKESVDFLINQLKALQIDAEIETIDMSVRSDRTLSGEEKMQAIHRATNDAKKKLNSAIEEFPGVAVGLGGGSGASMISEAFSKLPLQIPKILIAPFATDPRSFVADNNIILIPSVCDLIGLNSFIRQILRQTAFMIKGLCQNASQEEDFYKNKKAIGVTALGTTNFGVEEVCKKLENSGFSINVFHSNGFGGKALCRWISSNMLQGIIDFTIHELTMLLYQKNHMVPENRFTCAADIEIPRIIVPGGVNFFTRINMDEAEKEGLICYPHSPIITHIALSEAEMETCGRKLGRMCKKIRSPVTLLLPMKGFSSEDREGGMIENKKGRLAFAHGFESEASSSVKIVRQDAHINSTECAERAVQELFHFFHSIQS